MERANLNFDESINVKQVDEKRAYERVKRAFDFISALALLIVASPILLLVAISIKVTSKGKVVYGHTRIGRYGVPFKVYKFRSMYENANEIFNSFSEEQKKEYYINFKLDNDPRVTKVGDFLRKTSLDELPQLINIIKGEMSVVGPRPIVEKEIEKYGVYANTVFSVMPGLTGNWQANGRSDTTYDERVQMDVDYVHNRSFILDMKLIFKTFISVIKKEGAI